MKKMILAAFAVLLALPAASDELTLREVEKSIEDAWQSVDSLKAKMTMEATLPMQETPYVMTGEGDLFYTRDDASGKYRQELTIHLPEPLNVESEHVAIYNGDQLYLRNRAMGRQETRLGEPDFTRGAAPPGGKLLLETLNKRLKLKLLQDDEVDGKPVYVLQGEMRNVPRGGADQLNLIVAYIDKELGFLRRVEQWETPEIKRLTVSWSEPKLGVSLDPELFEHPESIGAETYRPSPEMPKLPGDTGEAEDENSAGEDLPLESPEPEEAE